MPGAGRAFFTGCLVTLEETVENSSFVDAKKSFHVFPRILAISCNSCRSVPNMHPHGNKALNLFSWKQLVVSQIQMPTCVLTANLLDERWIDYYHCHF